MSIRSLCDKQVDVHPRVETRGAAGSASYSWTEKRSGAKGTVACRIQPARAFDKSLAKQDGYDISHVLFFSEDPQLLYHDQVWYNGRKFLIEGIPIDVDELGRLWKVSAQEQEQRQV